MTNTSNVAQAEPEMEQTNTRLREDLKRRAEHASIDLRISLTALINEALERYLDKHEAAGRSGKRG